MEEQDLLTYASAIAFQTLTSLIPLALLTLSIMGFLDLGDVWTDDLAPQVKEQVSPEVFAVIDDVARRTLSSGQGWWLTVGVVFTLWQTSGVARAIMGALSRVYGDGERPLVLAPLPDLVRARPRGGGVRARRARRSCASAATSSGSTTPAGPGGRC